MTNISPYTPDILANIAWVQEHAPECSAEQSAAIISDEKGVVLVAGPGSGKTKTLVARVQRLIATGSDPKSMAGITFTNAAAAEMQHRLGEVRLDHLGTLHGLCLQLLRRHGITLGYGDQITMVDDDMAFSLMGEAAVAAGICKVEESDGSMRSKVEKLLEWRNLSDQFVPANSSQVAGLAAITIYKKRLRQQSAADFGMLLEDAVVLAERGLIPQYEHLLVDEVQDSGSLHYRFYQAFPAHHKFYCGDSDQAIYSWMGGRLEHLLALCELAETQVLNLEDNYRSLSIITRHMQQLIEVNSKRIAKKTLSKREGDGTITVQKFQTESDEARGVYLNVKTWLDEGIEPTEIAVLARTNAIAQSVAQELKARGIPVRERPQNVVDDNAKLRAALGALANPNSDLAIGRWLEMTRKPETYKKIRAEWRRNQKPLRNLAPEIPDGYRDAWGANLLNALARLGFNRAAIEPAKRAMRFIVSRDIGILIVALGRPEDREEGVGVTVTTFHSAKGREWKRVHLASCEQDIIARIDNAGDAILTPDEQLQEARRLFFVAGTRAKDYLVISYCLARRQNFGRKEIVACEPVQFIVEAGLDLPD